MKKRNKVSAEFSMSSLTDIIFLLLIFFMLTSSMIQINMELPESSSKTVAPTDYAVMMTVDGNVTFNGKKAKFSQIESLVRAAIADDSNKENATIAIFSEVGVPWEKVADIMEIASKLRMRAIIGTQPNLSLIHI